MLRLIFLILVFALPISSNAKTSPPLDISDWHLPLNYLIVTDIYGIRDIHHVSKERNKFHHGIDFRSRDPEPIYAVKDGVIAGINNAPFYGRIIEIDHGNGLKTRYAHLSKILYSALQGEVVKKGQIIGYTGRTGRVTGPHLHFEIILNGKSIDPFPLYGPLACKSDVNHDLCSVYYTNDDGTLDVVPSTVPYDW